MTKRIGLMVLMAAAALAPAGMARERENQVRKFRLAVCHPRAVVVLRLKVFEIDPRLLVGKAADRNDPWCGGPH